MNGFPDTPKGAATVCPFNSRESEASSLAVTSNASFATNALGDFARRRPSNCFLPSASTFTFSPLPTSIVSLSTAGVSTAATLEAFGASLAVAADAGALAGTLLSSVAAAAIVGAGAAFDDDELDADADVDAVDEEEPKEIDAPEVPDAAEAGVPGVSAEGGVAPAEALLSAGGGVPGGVDAAAAIAAARRRKRIIW